MYSVFVMVNRDFVFILLVTCFYKSTKLEAMSFGGMSIGIFECYGFFGI